MAAMPISPYVAADEISLTDAIGLLSETGHPISKTTLERQCRAAGVTLVRRGKHNWASWTSVLKVHAGWVDARETRD